MDFDPDSMGYKDATGGTLSEDKAQKYFKDLVKGMSYCKLYYPFV